MENDVWGRGDELSGRFVTQSGADFFTVTGSGTSPSVLARAIGMYLVGHMPEDGLMETITTLRDFFEFYATETRRYLPPTHVEKVQAVVTTESPQPG